MKFQRIQDLRTDADLSQKQISEILHISQRSYSHYETGSRNIPIEMLIRLANYYETSIDYLVGRTDKKKMPKSGGKLISPLPSALFSKGNTSFILYSPSLRRCSSVSAILEMLATSYSLKIYP